LEGDVIAVRGDWENSSHSPKDKEEVQTKAPQLAASLLLVSDNELRPVWQVVKYEYASYAFTMSASVQSAVTEQDRQTKVKYAEKGLENGRKMLDLVQAAKANYGKVQKYTDVIDFIYGDGDDEESRVRYLMAICLCRLADVQYNSKFKMEAQQVIN